MQFKKENIKPLLKVGIAIVSVCLFFGIVNGFRYDYSMVTALLSESNGIRYSEVQLAFTINTYVSAFSAPLLAALTIKKSSRFVLIGGIILSAAGLLVMVTATSLPMLILGVSILLAVGTSALSFGIIFGSIAPLVKENVSIVISTAFTVAATFFSILFVPVIKNLTDTIGFTATITAFSLLFIITIPLIFLFSKGEKDKEVQEIKKKIKFRNVAGDLFKNKVTIIMIIFMFCLGMLRGIPNHSYAALVAFGLQDASYIIIKIVSLAGSIFFTWFVIKIQKRLSYTSLVLLVYGVMEIAILLSPLDTPIYLVFASLGTFIMGMAYPLSTAIMRKEYVPYLLGTVICFTGVFSVAAKGINGSLGGIIFDATGSFDLLLVIEGIIGVAGAVAIFILSRMVTKEERAKKQITESGK